MLVLDVLIVVHAARPRYRSCALNVVGGTGDVVGVRPTQPQDEGRPQAWTASALRSRSSSTVNPHHGRADRILAARSPARILSQTTCQNRKCSRRRETLGATAEFSTLLCNNDLSFCKNGGNAGWKAPAVPDGHRDRTIGTGLAACYPCMRRVLCAPPLLRAIAHGTSWSVTGW
jgi:hypothetical protein